MLEIGQRWQLRSEKAFTVIVCIVLLWSWLVLLPQMNRQQEAEIRKLRERIDSYEEQQTELLVLNRKMLALMELGKDNNRLLRENNQLLKAVLDDNASARKATP